MGRADQRATGHDPREIEDRLGEGNALGGLGCCYAAAGDVHRAIEFYMQHLAIAKDIDHAEGQANSLYHWADALCELGQLGQAIKMMREAATILRCIESPLAKEADAKLMEWSGNVSEQK